ncbi:MAG: YciI family protein [Chloroflexota bacterium]
MRVMILAKSTPESELKPRGPEGYEEMAKFSDELTKAGVLLASEALQPSAKGARVRFDGAEVTVIDGPFTEAKELVAGYWIWQVRSLDEAIEWIKRAPFSDGMELEIRPIFEMQGPAGDPPEQA